EVAVALSLEVRVEHRVREQLQREREPGVAGAAGDDRSQVAAGAVSPDGEKTLPATHLAGVLRHPRRDGPGVVERGWEAVLRREPVVDRDDRAGGAPRERRTDAVHGARAPEHPAAAV